MDTQLRRLVLLRHAKSDWSTELPDHSRPLASRGRRDAPAAGRWLADSGAPLDLVVCSTAARARQTWELAAAALPAPPALRSDERVYDATAEQLLTLVRELPEQVGSVAVVGHNPGLELLAALLAGQRLVFRTATMAVLAWSGPWSAAGPGAARLDAHVTPRG